MSTKEGDNGEFEALLVYLKSSRGFDFSGYKRSTLQRRVQKRMSLIGIGSYTDYQDYLEVHQEEFPHLFNTILINVTSFFRDEDAWSYLAADVVPQVLQSKWKEAPIRVWVAGCASGEEAYTIAMVLAEAVGIDDFRERVKIYATDLDEDALNSCRAAAYSAKDLEAVAPELRTKYFEQVGDKYVFDRELRRSIIFGRHDLVQDAPISRIDLLLCRNTLMYFNAEAQERILARFHFALNDDGFLFLGKAETLLTHTSLFNALDIKNHVFSKVTGGRPRDRMRMFAVGGLEARLTEPVGAGKLREAAFDTGQVPQIVLDLAGRLCLANIRARTIFSISARDIGRSFHDLELSFRPAELRSGIEQAIFHRRTVNHKDVVWTTPGGNGVILEIQIAPLVSEGHDVVGASVTFEDITHFKRLQEELMNFNQELETAYEEVQSTNEELQTTNEELQSTVEELETTNEELQSTNEELETMNEELQSANEELEAINDEIRKRGAELDFANLLLRSILAGLRDGVIVLDQDFRILAWNQQSEDLWGLRADEAEGKHLMNLDFGLAVEQLRQPIRACLMTKEPQEVSMDAINRRGKPMSCQVCITPLLAGNGEQRGVILLTICTAITGAN